MEDWAATIQQFRQREYRRLVGISAAFHGVVLLFLIWNPIPRPPAALPGVVAVRFVSLPAPGPAAPEAEAAPPKPVPPVAKKVVLPAEPKKVETPKPKPEVKVEKPKPEPKQAEPKPEVKPEPKKAEEKDLDDLMAQWRNERGEAAPVAQAPVASVPGPAIGMPGSATGVPISPEEAEWRRRVTIHIGRAWVRPGFAGKSISSEVQVQIDAGGQVLGEPRLTRRSGNPWFDDDALRAAQRASPLPPPPSPGEYTIVFSSEDF